MGSFWADDFSPQEAFRVWARALLVLAFLAWVGLSIAFALSATRLSTAWYAAEYRHCLDAHPGDASVAPRCAEQTLLLLRSEVHADWVWGAVLAGAVVSSAWVVGRCVIGGIRWLLQERAQSV